MLIFWRGGKFSVEGNLLFSAVCRTTFIQRAINIVNIAHPRNMSFLFWQRTSTLLSDSELFQFLRKRITSPNPPELIQSTL